MLNVNDIYAGYDTIQIVNGITMQVENEKIVAIVGANGVGKSTLIKAIMGQIPLMKGSVFFDGQDISLYPTHTISDIGITLVPEGRQLFTKMTVEENLDMGSCTKKTHSLREKNKEAMYELFPRLRERAKQIAGTLSGGEQQMVATARALMSNPKLLIMDEPSWGLAPILVEEMFETIDRVKKQGTSVLIIEQNVSKTLQSCDWAYVIEGGKICMEGYGLDLLERDDLKKAYLGL